MTYWRLHYHILWSTHDHQPSLTPAAEKALYNVIYSKAQELDLIIHAVGNVDDHAHVALSIPPRVAIAEVVRQLKGASAYAINHMRGSNGQFSWQAGYGALTVSDSQLGTVARYTARQKIHHKNRTIMDIYERIDEE